MQYKDDISFNFFDLNFYFYTKKTNFATLKKGYSKNNF